MVIMSLYLLAFIIPKLFMIDLKAYYGNHVYLHIGLYNTYVIYDWS